MVKKVSWSNSICHVDHVRYMEVLWVTPVKNLDTGSLQFDATVARIAADIRTNLALDPFGKIPEFKFCAARVEKAMPRAEAAE